MVSFVPVTKAQENVTSINYHFDETTIATGWTLRLSSGANITYFPNVLPAPADVTWSVSAEAVPVLPPNTAMVGQVYRVTVSGVTSLNTATHKPAVALPDVSSFWAKSIYYYDLATQAWSKAATKKNSTTNKWQAAVASLDAYVVVLEDRATQEGKATYYGTYYKTTNLTLVAASNTFRKNTRLRVTNLENGKSVIVKVVDTGAFKEPIIIDLSTPAFTRIATKSQGVVRVRVTTNLSVPKTTTTPAPAVSTDETLPDLTPVKQSTTAVPKVSAASYQVLDAASGQVLAEWKADSKRSIASITKLMTAVVYLDTKPNIRDSFTYRSSDGTGKDARGVAYGYNNLKLRVGDKLQERDLLYATLVGSANNGASALIRAAGMTRTEFVEKMNAKAQAWGLTSTHFVEPSGLDPANVSSAADIATLAARALHEYQPIRYITTRTRYVFKASLSGVHTMKTTDTLLTGKNSLNVTGGKTGYIDESRYTYVLRVKNQQGAQVVVSVLGAPSSGTRFNDAAQLASWAFKTYTWKS